jgi:hypothetical protein
MVRNLITSPGERWPLSDLIRRQSLISAIAADALGVGSGSMITGLPPGLDWEICDRARLARDRAFDGLFFTGVRTTRIYCRLVCSVWPARSANVAFFGSAAATERAGFRPCLRCRPETAPGSPAWNGTATTCAAPDRRGISERSFGCRPCLIDLVSGHAICWGYLFATQERRQRRLQLLDASKKPSGSSTRPRCQCQRSPSPLASAACGALTMPFGPRMAARLHHSARSEPAGTRSRLPRSRRVREKLDQGCWSEPC